MALDVGDKRIGVALAHAIARFPSPLTTLQNTETVRDEISALVEKEHVGAVVVGLPRGMDGGYTAQTRSAEAFQQALATKLNVPVYLGDETLTSVMAEQVIGNKPHTKGDIDAQAACFILESFLVEHTEVLAV